MKKGTINSAKFTLSYVVCGEGKVTILVIGSAVYYPRTFLGDLYKHLKFVFVDHRGFASCNKKCIEEDFSLENIITDIEKVRQELKLGKVIVLGHSGHGYMALEYAKRYSQYTTKVVLIATGPSNSSHNHQLAQEYFDSHASTERKQTQTKSLEDLDAALKADPNKRFITFCIKLGPRSWYDYNYDATSLWKGVSVNMLAFDYLWGKVFAAIDITQGLENFDIPVLVILGKYDYIVAPYYTWDKIKDKFKNIQIHVFQKSSHTSQMEEPEEFAKVLTNFMEKITHKKPASQDTIRKLL